MRATKRKRLRSKQRKISSLLRSPRVSIRRRLSVSVILVQRRRGGRRREEATADESYKESHFGDRPEYLGFRENDMFCKSIQHPSTILDCTESERKWARIEGSGDRVKAGQDLRPPMLSSFRYQTPALSTDVLCQRIDTDDPQSPLLCKPPTIIPSRHLSTRICRVHKLAQ